VEYLNNSNNIITASSATTTARLCCCLLQLLLGAEVGGVSARLLAAIGRPGVEPGVALPADHLVAGLPIKKPTQKNKKNHLKNPLKMVFCFILFL
jgi:hypothetical protein